MKLLRRFLQLLVGLLCILSAAMFLSRPEWSIAIQLIFFAFIFLLLGPWWPKPVSPENQKFNLLTDRLSPKAALIIACAICSALSFWYAWEIYWNPGLIILDRTTKTW